MDWAAQASADPDGADAKEAVGRTDEITLALPPTESLRSTQGQVFDGDVSSGAAATSTRTSLWTCSHPIISSRGKYHCSFQELVLNALLAAHLNLHVEIAA